MKNSIKNIAIIAIVIFTTFSFTTLVKEKKQIKTKSSTVTWKAYKVTGSEKGIISLKSGTLTFANKKLTGGEFVIDMNTITSTDLKGEWKGKLEGHLKSNDFFGVAKYPTATLTFKKATAVGKNTYKVTGNLTIKGKTNKITFAISVYGNKATANLKIDRTKYDVKYGSTSFFDGLKDKAIYDEFDLIVDLEF
jgi:polyisoprenoid-binding protein YceI